MLAEVSRNKIRLSEVSGGPSSGNEGPAAAAAGI